MKTRPEMPRRSPKSERKVRHRPRMTFFGLPRDPAGAHGHIPRIVFTRDIRNLALFSVDRHRAHSTAQQGIRLASPISGLGIPVDTGALRYRGVRYRYKSLAGTASSIVHRAGGDHAWNTILLLLAQSRSAFRSPRGENCSAWYEITLMNPKNFFVKDTINTLNERAYIL
jgi:hypothetical protein